MKELLNALKEHLKAKQHHFHQHYDWWGDTESGFTEHDEFDMDDLLDEIDKFGEELRTKEKTK